MSLPDHYETFRQMMENRRSLRNYSGAPVTEEEKKQIIETAILAPTAGNMMLYSILEIAGQDLKKKIAEINSHQSFIAKSSFVLLFLADYQRWYDFYCTDGAPEMCLNNGLQWREPEEADLLLACCDAMIVAQTAVMAAESLGIGSCYFGTAMERIEEQRKLLNLSPWVFPLTLVAFGHYPEGPRPARRERLPRSMVHFVDQYRRVTDQELEFMESHGKNWSIASIGAPAENVGQRMYLRKNGAPFAFEEARSVKAALKVWLQGEEEGPED